MEPYIINQTGDQLQSILNKAIIKAELQTTEDGNQAICFTASDGTSISITLPEAPNIEYLLRNIYYLQEGIGCAAFDYTMSLGGVTIQSEEVTRQDSDSIILDTSANRFVLERGGKFYTKFASGGGNLQGSDVYASRRYTFLNRQDKSYWYRKADGTLAQGSSTFVIGNWLKTLQSECDSTQEAAETARTAAQEAQTTATAANGTANESKETAQEAKEAAAEAKTAASEAKMNATAAMNTARSASLNATAANGTATAANGTANEAKETADAAKATADAAQAAAETAQTTAADLLQDTPWEGRHMNMFTETGEFHIHGERTDANDGLPILNAGTIDARLTVLDSSLTNGTGEDTDIVVTQILRLSNRTGGDGHVYVRTGQAATKSKLATPSSTAWGTWEKLMGMFEKNAVKNIADLDTYTTNGMYSGLFHFEDNVTSAINGGVKMFTGSTFLVVTVNGYAVANAGLTPQLTQMLYLLPAKDFNAPAKIYLRTAAWDASAKVWNYQNWDKIATANDLSPITAEVQSAKTLANSAQAAAAEALSNSATAQTAADTAQDAADTAQETATAASNAAQEAKTAAETAQATATAASAVAAAAKQTAENEATARTEADTELQSQINGKQDNIGSFSADEKAAFLVSLGLGKIGVVSQKQTWNDVGVEPAYVMSEKVEGFISKDNINSLISYGFAFNEGTGYFELNGLTDISLQEALNIVAAGKPNFSLCELHYAGKNIRTNLPILNKNVNYLKFFGSVPSSNITTSSVAFHSDIEVFVYLDDFDNCIGIKYCRLSKAELSFMECTKLEKIYVIPGNTNSFWMSFNSCYRLKELKLVYLMCDVNLSSSAYLSAKSTHIMIAKAENKNTITITLHPDAKARWEASEYYEEDIQTIISKNITIA